MKKKKNDQSNLERKRFLFFEIGILTVLALLLIGFEYGTKELNNESLLGENTHGDYEIEEVMPIVRDFKKVKPPLVPETIILIDDEVPLIEDPEIDWGVEVGINDPMPEYDFGDEESVPDVFPFFALQTKPSYHGGGQGEFQRHLQKLVEYPSQAQDAGIDGRVTIAFVVDENGKVIQINILKSPHPSLTEAVKMAINKTDKWSPGEQQGRKVRVSYTLPVYFKLN